MASNNINTKKLTKKTEEPSHVQKLLASLQQAQSKSNQESSSEPSTSKAKKNEKRKKSGDEKKKPKGPSVGARMQQQAQVAQQNKRPRHVSASKSGGAGRPQNAQETHQPHYSNYQQHRGPRIPTDILDELEFRFVSNMVDYELNDNIRVCFHLELAHWYYIDHMVEDEKYKGCPNIGTRDFTVQMYHHCKDLRKHAHRADEVVAKFREYKSTVPTYGAILLDPDLEHVLLVQSYFSKGNNWGFPKGKINEAEPPRDAAIRETFEETGFDFSLHSEKEKKFQRFINEAMVRLYVVKDVPRSFNFQPQTRKEIRKIEWFRIDDLPTDKNDELPAYLHGYKFFMVIPFVQDIQTYVRKEREKRRRRPVESTAPSSSSLFSELFPKLHEEKTPSVTPTQTIYKRLTSEELFSSFKKTAEVETVSRPTLPEISPAVNGLDSLAVLGLCTPLKPGSSLNNFSAPTVKCPVISEEASGHADPLSNVHQAEIGFAMPLDLQQPVVTSEHPWQLNKSSENTAPPQTLESHQGWLDTQLVNTIMHSPNPPMPSAASPATPTAVLGHLIGKPIQPQAIFPQAATPTALGSAEKPKSSKINLSDHSAFKAISSSGSSKQSVPKATAPPSTEKMRSSSLSGTGGFETNKPSRNLFQSVTSPASSGMPSVHGDETAAWEDVWHREHYAATADTSISSLAASNQELAMINRDTPVEDRINYMKHSFNTSGQPQTFAFFPGCQQWTKRLQLDTEYIAGPMAFWMQQFSVSNNTPSATI